MYLVQICKVKNQVFTGKDCSVNLAKMSLNPADLNSFVPLEKEE